MSLIRLPGARFNRGRIATAGGVASPAPPAVGPLDPLTIVSSVTPIFYFIGDLGITIGTGVSAWADQTGNARHATQATGGSQPLFTASDADFGNRGSVYGDGVDDSLNVAWDPPAPGTTPMWFFAIMRQVTYTAGEYLWGGGNLILALGQSPSTPSIRQFNNTGANANTGAAVGTSVRVEALYSNSVSDYIKAGATTTTGVSAGNLDAAAFSLFSRPTSGFSDTKYAAVLACAGQPTAGERTNLDAWVTAYYGAGVGV